MSAAAGPIVLIHITDESGRKLRYYVLYDVSMTEIEYLEALEDRDPCSMAYMHRRLRAVPYVRAALGVDSEDDIREYDSKGILSNGDECIRAHEKWCDERVASLHDVNDAIGGGIRCVFVLPYTKMTLGGDE